MDALEFLNRAYRVDKQIESKMQQIRRLREMAEGVSGPVLGEPVKHTRNVTGLSDAVAKVIEEEHRLNEQIDELVAVKREISEVIDLLPNTDWKLVLEKRYLGFQLWVEVADDLDRSVRWAQMRHKEAVEAVQGILDEREREE